MKKIKVWVETDKVASRTEIIVDLDEDDFLCDYASDSEGYMRDWFYDELMDKLITWGFEEVREAPE